MTLFDFNQFSEIKESGWAFDTLKPPLNVKHVLLDFKIQWQSYCSNNLSLHRRISFLILRVFQRFAYNFGWIISNKTFKKNRNK